MSYFYLPWHGRERCDSSDRFRLSEILAPLALLAVATIVAFSIVNGWMP